MKISCRDLGDDEIANFKESDDNMSEDADDESPPIPVHRPKPTPHVQTMVDDSDSETPPVPVHRLKPTPRVQTTVDNADNETPPAPIRRPKITPCVRTTRKESAPAPTRQSSTRGFDFLDKIAQSLNPEHQAQRDAKRTSALFQSQQLILLQAQIRDLNQLVQTLRTQLDESERRRVDADRRADRLENQIYITSVVNQAQIQQPVAHPSYREPPVTATLSESCPSTPDQDRRWEATYRDGGHSSWFGNGHQLNSDDDAVEVNPIPWSPSPRSPVQSPPLSDLE